MTETTREAPGGVGVLDSVVMDVPDVTRATAFWTALTGASPAGGSDDVVVVRTPDGWNLAFQPAPGLVTPEWPGQERPQQLHLDLRVPDVAEATARAVGLGARVLRENEAWTTLADPAGHPFDLCRAEDADAVTIMGVTVDCPDPHELVTFWAALLGEPVTYDADGMGMVGNDGATPVLFQQVEGYRAPRWPDPAFPQQLHLDLTVASLDAAEAAALGLGAVRLPGDAATFRTFADPAGHPFCLCLYSGAADQSDGADPPGS
ncbi:hypothetical protein Bcav_1802 [Beutenbergia cavernae DSM 12333]|uniref:VOC domain-containing protein n=1 Tax=Beutenbergia cavernae (strain ATCC BAA-8 / DSM 12333 / CCUG 43141 / JCM 11478 / NBRC 16432 / NCIMB 13614 / HKI 0122) TaxID=471853 RepID=C5C4T0_BEUC1|nr:VOC family protein [Beutenbergia cavernae]ACQ80058.1 hypothetical protein Bcav_1802 [Beutenbergia cavernae DSM 12333]